MKNTSAESLEELESELEEGLDRTEEEREELGLPTADNYEAELTFYGSEGAMAVASPPTRPDDNPLISVNAILVVWEELSEEEQKAASQLTQFFDHAREFFGQVPEQFLLEFIDSPQQQMAEFESQADDRRLAHKRNFFEQRGRSYQQYKQDLVQSASAVSETLTQLTPSVKEEFKGVDIFPVLRHEYDHIDFYTTPIFEQYLQDQQEASEMRNRLEVEGEESLSGEYADHKMELLHTMSEIKPLIELRAMVFNHVEPGSGGQTDFDEVEGRITDDFSDYVEGAYLEDIVDGLVAQHWASGEMNRQTSNHVFQTVNQRQDSMGEHRYEVDSTEVDHELATQILYEELPGWQQRYMENAVTAADAITTAYKEDPGRFQNANQAKTFQDFIEELEQ